MRDAYLLRSRVLTRFPQVAVILLLSETLAAGGAAGQGSSPQVRIDLDQAIQLALQHNHALLAARSTVNQSRAQEITAGLRPNPVFTYDDLFVPITPAGFSSATFNNITEFDVGANYTFERGHKRQARVRAARDLTTVTESQVKDNERSLTFSVAQQFVSVLLAKSTLDFAKQDLASFQQTVNIGQERYKLGAISEGDFLKIKLQLLQFQTDVSSAQLALVQSLASLRQSLGYDAVPANYDVIGDLAYTPLRLNKQDLELLAIKQRPDLLAAEQGVTAAQSQYGLAKANGKRDVTTDFLYTHVSAINSASFILNFEIPIFDRNQGEIARTHYAIGQSQENEKAAEDTVMTDVTNGYEGVRTDGQVVELYQSGYLKQAQDSRDISEYAYKRGAASLLDFLDAERSYRSTQLAYRQAEANYMLAMEQLREAVGTRNLP
ncbi:MAG TPA: TolC family protein [Terriglobia bacterium]|nr:TolC family protein [Terriglobia bacterium]